MRQKLYHDTYRDPVVLICRGVQAVPVVFICRGLQALPVVLIQSHYQYLHKSQDNLKRKLNKLIKYRASAKGALAKGPFLLRGPIHCTMFSTGPIHCTCIFNLRKKNFLI